MTYMNNDVDFAVSGGVQELNMGEVELVGGARPSSKEEAYELVLHYAEYMRAGVVGAYQQFVQAATAYLSGTRVWGLAGCF